MPEPRAAGRITRLSPSACGRTPAVGGRGPPERGRCDERVLRSWHHPQLSASFVAERNARVAFHPAAGAVGYQFGQFNVVFRDAGDMAVVLAEVIADVDRMDHALRILDQRFRPALAAERAYHLQAVQREGFQRLAHTILIRVWTGAVQ